MARYRYDKYAPPRPMTRLDIGWHFFVALGVPFMLAGIMLAAHDTPWIWLGVLVYVVLFFITVAVDYYRDRAFQLSRKESE